MGQNAQGALFALLAFGIFATHDLIVKFLGGLYSPIQIIFFATMFSFPLVTFMLMRDATVANLRPVHPWWTALRTAFAMGAAFLAFFAFTVLPLAETYAILFATPLLITVLAIPMLGEKVGLHRGLAVLAGLVGVVVVLQPGSAPLSWGHLAALGAAACGGMASIIVRKIGKDERTVVLLLYPMAANFVLMSILLYWVYEPMPIQHMGAIGLMAVMGFAAGLFLIMAYKRAEAAAVAPMQYSQIIWASFYGFLFFGEAPMQTTLIGAGIIISSGLYIVLRESLQGDASQTPVLRTRSRGYGSSFRISPFLRRRKGSADNLPKTSAKAIPRATVGV